MLLGLTTKLSGAWCLLRHRQPRSGRRGRTDDDDIGLDATEIAAAMGVAMDAGLLEFGDGVEVCRILREEIALGTPLGRIIGNGAASVGGGLRHNQGPRSQKSGNTSL